MSNAKEKRPPQNLFLSIALRAAREKAKFGVRELGRRIGVSPGLISNWEYGSRAPHLVDVGSILGALGVVGDEKQRITNLARASGPGTVAFGIQANRDHLATTRDCEALADNINVWHPLLLPDILRIPDYSEAVLVAQGFATKDARRLATISTDSGKVIIGRDATPVTAFIGAAALTEPVGSPEIMGRQIGFLDDLAATSHRTTVRIVPDNIGWHPGLSGPVTLFATPLATVAYFSHHGAGSFLPDHGGEYSGIIERLDKVAKTPLESAMIIEDLATKSVRAPVF
ncbi:helix-turn-helix domain-containing protein [Amycolatopsis saalfeldensis]|uniref:Helix-turn-helix domain-containing protein n=1 Tax=Amycolatopsis saalfeldensis TaxID=394193 RepID=A0A1H8YNM5_9PSEU|nr:helix-turn-helix transcriptional regulator [Amycolatopsis saalfeldensis]SEP53780.1 Helix-turn-helix domain-containing protein [Amycolatopsis saalfeldensis]